MSQQSINAGTQPDDVSADSAYIAFGKVISNFADHSAAITALQSSVFSNAGTFNVLNYGAVCDATVAGTGTDDTAAIQRAVDAIPAGASGVIYVPNLAKVSSTINAADKLAIAFVGPSSSNMLRPASLKGPKAGFVCAIGWGATTPVIKVTSSSTLSENGGACTLENFALVPSGSGNGWGLLIEKSTVSSVKNVFIGNINVFNSSICYFAKGIAIDDSANHSFSAPTANGNGFGWLTVRNSRIVGNNFGIHANCALNVVNVRDCIFAHSYGASNGNFKSRTGGAIILTSGLDINITGNDLEDSQVGVQLGAAGSVTIAGNYFEANPDGAVICNGTKDVIIEGNYCSSNVSYRSNVVYLEACRNVRVRGNAHTGTGGVYCVLADHNRDIETDTPNLTQFHSLSNGSQTTDGKGVVIQSLSLALRQAPIAMNNPMSSAALSNATQAEVTGINPLGFVNKGAAITATSANGTVRAAWSSVAVAVGQYVVTSCVYRMDSTVGTNPMLLIIEEDDGQGGGLAVVYSSTIDSSTILRGEDVMIQWHRNVTAATSAFKTQLWPEIPTIGDVAKIYGFAQTVSDFAFPRPMGWEVISSGGTERYYSTDGRVFFGANAAAAPPAGTSLTWKVGEQVWRNAPAAGEIPGWVCTGAGAGGTAVFKAMGALAA